MKTAGDILKETKREVYCVAPDATCEEALKVMAKHNIGAILIKDKKEVVGIWTERDLIRNSVEPGFDIKTSRIKDHMSTNLKYAQSDENVYHMMDKFLGLRLRHLLIEKNGKFLGMLSSGDVLKEVLWEKNKEIKDITSIVGWEYYENWKVK